MKTDETGEILFIDKPKGITSFDVIRRLRRMTGKKKFGHAGTLDPLASGLLIVGVGAATKKLHGFLKLPKVYEAEILLGRRTDTGDVAGKTIDELRIKNCELREEEIQKILKGMVGKLELPVPMYSAVKRGGEALYKKARRGEQFTPPIKPMEVRAAEFLGVRREGEEVILKIRFDVGSGTYIRSLAEELGRRLCVPATLANLRRISIGNFSVADAKKLDRN